MIDFLNSIRNAKEPNRERNRNTKAQPVYIEAIKSALINGLVMSTNELMKATGYGRESITFATKQMVNDGLLNVSVAIRSHVFEINKQ